MRYPVVRVAHRGASVECPENTLLAFRRAIEHGIDALEIDLHLTQDGRLVIIHDNRLERTTNGKGLVRGHSLSQLKALDAGLGERIPELAEVFRLVEDLPVRLCLEIKGGDEMESLEIADAAVNAVEAHGQAGRVILTSFYASALLRSRALQPGLSLMLDPSPQDGSLSPRQICEQTLRAGANCLSYDFRFVSPQVAEEARCCGLALWPWNPNQPEEIEQMLRLFVPGIMTDRPEILNEVMGETHGSKSP